jgi:DNA polymerase-1
VKRIAFDIESHIVRPGMLFPKGVCVSFFDGQKRDIALMPIGVPIVLKYLGDKDVILVGHNVAFDLGVIAAEAIDMGYDPHWVMTLIFTAYAENRIVDTMIRCMLVDIAQGTFQEIDGQRRGKMYGLDRLAFRWLQRVIQKKDTWRLHYAYLENVPLAQWPPDAIDYAEIDAEITWLVDQEISSWAITEGIAPPGDIPDEFRQTRAAWVLHLMAGWGVRIDSEMVKLVRANLEVQRDASYQIMDQYKLFKKDKFNNYKMTKKGQRSINQKKLKQYIAEGFAARGETPPMTAGRKNKQGVRVPEVKCGADEALASSHPACMAFAHCANAVKLLSTYIPALERGNNGRPVTSGPNVLVASGRTSWTNPNWQNPPQIGGIRECVIPRPGQVFVGADLDTVELRALAQSCLERFGHSQMAAALQRGEDLHTSLACDMVGVTYAQGLALLAAGDPVFEEARAIAKKCNFGLGGGMGAAKFAWTASNDGQPLDPDPKEAIKKAFKYKEVWLRRWPEMVQHLQDASYVTGDNGPCMIEQAWSGRIRGGLEYCAAANTVFQGRVADGAKLALWRLAWACYVDKTNILYGSRLILFLHDEVILECPEDIAHLCADEIVKILCGAVQEVIPDIPITSKPVVTRRWFKGAKPVYVNGRIVPGKPEVVSVDPKTGKKKVKWVHDEVPALQSTPC